jgi:hypothetical protein
MQQRRWSYWRKTRRALTVYTRNDSVAFYLCQW